MYNFIENYSASISSTALISSSLEILQIHLKTLEDLITGSKTRILAFYSLATLPSSSSNMELSSSSIISTLSSPPSLSSPHHNTSMVRNPNQWISLNSSIPQTNTTKLPQGKNKLKTNKISESDKKTLIIQPIPPLFEPIPCKPIFYDIALNYLELHVNDVLDTRCGVKKSNKMKSNTSSNSLSTSSPSPSSAATGGLVGAAASWLGWFSGSK